jgi:hypothetical protein
MWGHRQHTIMDMQKIRGKHYLVMERGYIGDRFQWTSLGFDGLNGRAKFPYIDDGLKRWNKHFARFLKPWKQSDGKLALIMGQVLGDASIEGVDFNKWVSDVSAKFSALRYDVHFRRHPVERSRRVNAGAVPEMNGVLADALAKADVVLTYNSNSGVDAVLAGTAVYAEDRGSMVYELGQGLKQPDRTAWTKKMAYTQWLPEEIENGSTWEALKTVIRG